MISNGSSGRIDVTYTESMRKKSGWQPLGLFSSLQDALISHIYVYRANMTGDAGLSKHDAEVRLFVLSPIVRVIINLADVASWAQKRTREV